MQLDSFVLILYIMIVNVSHKALSVLSWSIIIHFPQDKKMNYYMHVYFVLILIIFFLEFFRNFYASFWFCYAPLYVRYKTMYTEWTLSSSLGWLVHTLQKIQKWCMILKIYELFANYLILCINELYFLSIEKM